jgi:hypothetical protein
MVILLSLKSQLAVRPFHKGCLPEATWLAGADKPAVRKGASDVMSLR